MERFFRQAQASYLRSPQDFLAHRLRYYSDMTPWSLSALSTTILTTSSMTSAQRQQRVNVIERLACTRAELMIVTATKNRVKCLAEIYATLVAQQACPDWLWLIIDNGSCDGTMDFLTALGDTRLLAVSYTERTGCAFPVRNLGLDLLMLGLRKNHRANQWILVLDSDDRLHNAYSLHEVASMRRAWSGRRLGQVLLHGFAVCEYEDEQGMVTYGTHPHHIAASFPHIGALAEIFDKGLNILAGVFPVEVLNWLRYPEEFSFEDNGLNHKLLLQARRTKRTWLATPYPITVKRFNTRTMAAQNNALGDQHASATIGEHEVTGIRAQIVTALHSLTDYFQREAL
jgi:hypothetical protein